MIAFLALWLILGSICLGVTARTMGYLRWSDLLLVPFEAFWLATPFWRNENGKQLWSREP